MRPYSKYYLGGLAALFLALPVWAHTDTSNFQIDQPVQVGKTELQPGNYVIRANEGGNTLDILRGGAMVAEVPCRWVELAKKSSDNEFATNDNHKVTEIQFSGRTKAIQLSE
jgi:hypothetical protein